MSSECEGTFPVMSSRDAPIRLIVLVDNESMAHHRPKMTLHFLIKNSPLEQPEPTTCLVVRVALVVSDDLKMNESTGRHMIYFCV